MAIELLRDFGAATTMRAIAIGVPPPHRGAPAGSAWLTVTTVGVSRRNAPGAVHPSWEAGLVADAYADAAAMRHLRPLAGVTHRTLGDHRATSASQKARHGLTGSGPANAR